MLPEPPSDFLDEPSAEPAPPPRPARRQRASRLPDRADARRNGNGSSHDPITARELPHNLPAEFAALSCILIDPKLALTICADRSILQPEDFYSPANRIVFEAMLELSTHGEMPETITLCEVLTRRGDFQSIGGDAAIEELASYVETTAHWKHFIRLIQEHSDRRRAIRESTALVERLYEGEEFDDVSVDSLSRAIESGRSRRAKPARLPAIDDVNAITYANLPPVPGEIIKGLFHRTTKLVLGGGSKSFKTWALMDLAVAVSTGSRFWGLETERLPVTYINFEIPRSFAARRLQWIEEVKGVRPANGMLRLWTLRGHVRPVGEIIIDLLESLERIDSGLIILDPIYKLFEGLDENKAGDTSMVLNRVEQLCLKLGAGCAFGAHFSKGNQAGKEAIDRIGGSGVFARDPDTILTMTAHEEAKSFTVDATLRNLPPVDPFVVTWNAPLFERDTALNPDDIKRPAKPNPRKPGDPAAKEQRRRELRIEDFLGYFPSATEAHWSPSEVQNEAHSDGFRAPGRTLYYWQKECLDRTWIEPDEIRGKRYRRTALGDQVVANDQRDQKAAEQA